MSDPEGQDKNRQQYVFNLTLAAVAAQVGCLTIVIIFVALFAGLWLDRTYSTKPLFTMLFMISSMPVSLFLMFKVAKGATDRMRPVIGKKKSENSEGGSES